MRSVRHRAGGVRHRAALSVLLLGALSLSACSRPASAYDDGTGLGLIRDLPDDDGEGTDDDGSFSQNVDAAGGDALDISETLQDAWDSFENLDIPDQSITPGEYFVTGPVDDFLDRIWGAREVSTERIREATRQALEMQIYLANCMAQYGFEFIPGLWGFSVDFPDFSLLTEQMGTREFAATYGFGISNPYWQTIVRNWRPQPGPNPNDATFDSLSPAGRQAWMDAMFGAPGDDGLPIGGCSTAADRAVNWVHAPEEFAGIQQEVWAFNSTLDNATTIESLNAEWAACLGDEGFPRFANQETMRSRLWDQFRPHGMELTDPAERAEFAEREKAIAVADWDCREALNYDARRREMEIALQYEFVDRHWAELEAWALHMEETRQSR